jgi:Flp pilus assembly protein TadG
MFLKKAKILKNEKGASAVEFAIILIPLFVLIFAIFQFGILFNNWIALNYAAREGARLAAVDAYDEATVRARAPSVNIDSITVTPLHGAIGSPVTVTVRGKVLNFALPLVPGTQKSISLTSSATLMIEYQY